MLSTRSNRFANLAIAIWCVALIASFSVDRSVAQWVAAHHPIDKHAWPVALVKLPGLYWTTLGIAALLFAMHPRGLRAAALPLASGALGGLAYLLIKWIVGRRRPVILIAPFHFEPFIGGVKGLFRQSGLCFPSGHTCLSFATAMSLTILIPRWRALWFLIASMVAAERVLENAHYLSDVIAGIGVGTLCALITCRAIDRYWPSEPSATIRGFPVGK